MRIVFFSDAHGNQYSVKNFFKTMDIEKPDIIVFGGDIFGYYYGQPEIISMLRNSNCVCLLGNHDQFFLDLLDGKSDEDYLVGRYGSTYHNVKQRIRDEDVRFIRSLKSRFDMMVDGLSLTFVHGSVLDPLNGRVYPDTVIEDLNNYQGIDYVFMGHTHHKLLKTLSNGTVLLNPGSIGQQRDGEGCTFGVFDSINRTWKTVEVEYDRDALVAEIKCHIESEQMNERLVEVLFRKKD